MSLVFQGSDYHDNFDPDKYLKTFYKNVEGCEEESGLLSFFLKSLDQICSKIDTKGPATLVDVGSGPNIHQVISLSSKFDQIYLTEFTDRNRKALEAWINRDKTAHDWSPIFKFVANLEVDGVCSSLCLEAACKDLGEYGCSMKKIASLLRLGGYLVLVGVLGEEFYAFGDAKFFCLKMSRKDVTEAIESAGIKILDWIQYDRQVPESAERLEFSDYEGCFVMLGQKSNWESFE